MELEGFGVSLLGKAVYVYADSDKAWLPWEFIAASYTSRILICGDVKKTTLAYTQTWSAVFSPTDVKLWSAVATVIRGLGGTGLIVFDVGCPEVPQTFFKFLEQQTMTRVWIGKQTIVPIVPDAIFFPTGSGMDASGFLQSLPARNGHGTWNGMSLEEFKTLNESVASNNLGFVISDVGETAWTLFWHRESDSEVPGVAPKKLVEALLQVAASIVRTLP